MKLPLENRGMKLPLLRQNSDSGFILVVTLVILLLLVVLGISATTTGIFETKIAGNEKVYKTTFYEADGATEIAAMLIEENVSCPTGFAGQINDDNDIITIASSLDFWMNPLPNPDPADLCWVPWDPTADRDIVYTPEAKPNTVTNIRLGGQTILAMGGAMQMAAGYQGKGKAAGSGGAHLLYDVYVQHQGARDSESRVVMQWRHSIGQEGQCKY
jgi:hypothetical protein